MIPNTKIWLYNWCYVYPKPYLTENILTFLSESNLGTRKGANNIKKVTLENV